MSNVGAAVLGVVGGVIGFFLGGPVGAAIGAGIGLATGSLLLPAETDLPPIEPGGLRIQTSQYGRTIPVIYGHRRVAGNLIFYGNFRAHRHETEHGGKGGGGVTSVHHTYTVSLAFGLCMGVKGIRRFWVGKEEHGIPRFYDGTQTTPDPHIQSVLAAQGHTRFPVWKNLCYVVLENFDLGGSPHVPQFNFEVVDKATAPLAEVAALVGQTNIQGACAVSWNPTGDRIAVTGDGSDSIVVYSFEKSTNSLAEVAALLHQPIIDRPLGVSWNPTGDRIAVVGMHANSIVVYSFEKLTNSLTEVAALVREKTEQWPHWTILHRPLGVSWNPTGDRIAAVGLVSDSIVVYSFEKSTNSLARVAELLHQPNIDGAYGVSWNPTGDRIAVTGEHADSIVVYSFEKSRNSLTEVAALVGQLNINCPFAVSWNPTGDRIAVTGWHSDSIVVYSFEKSTNSLAEAAALVGQLNIIGPRAVSWNPAGNRIAVTGEHADSIVVYSFEKLTNSLTEVAALAYQPIIDRPFGVSWNPTGDRIAVTGYRANSIVVYSFEEHLRDTLPAKITEDILTNDLYGLGLPAANLDLVAFGETNTYCETHNLKLSLNFANKVSVLDALRHVINHHNGYISYSAGLIAHNQLKTETAVGNIVETDIVARKDQFPVQISKGSGRDHKNKIIVQFTNQAKDYVVGTASAEDMVDIDQYGLKEESANLPGLTNYDTAEKLANLLLRKSLTNPEALTFQLGPKKLGLKPGEVWAITDADTEISNKDYRIMTVGENEDYRLQITAIEEIPEINELSVYGADTSTPPQPPDLIGDPCSVVNVLIVEPPAVYSAVPRVVITFSESGRTSWAGASVYRAYSLGGTYTRLFSREQDGITGTVTAIGEIDGTKNIEVTLDYDDTLSSAASYNDFIITPKLNLMMARTATGDRYLRFQNADLLAARVWRLSGLLDDAVHFPQLNEVAIAVGNKIGLHKAFVFSLPVPATDRLRTLFYKIPSLNFAGIEQSLADVSATSITLTDASARPLPPFNLQINDIGVDSTDTVITQQNTDQVISWQSRNRHNTGGYDFTRTDVIVNDSEFENFEIEVYVGANLKRIVTQTAKSWTYTTAMQTADGTTLDNLIIKLRQHNSSLHSDQKSVTINRA